MAFRRVILSGDKVKAAEADILHLLNLSKTKIDFPTLKVDIKKGLKPETIVIDVNGDGADSFSKKIKDAGVKHQTLVTIKTEKPMDIKAAIKEVFKEMKVKTL
jgi:DNA-directed RNA polymerase subunit L